MTTGPGPRGVDGEADGEADGEQDRPADPSPADPSPADPLLAAIDALRADLASSGTVHLAPAPLASVRRQLDWCRAYVATGAEPSPRPGPFSMGPIATRELDMYGDQPEVAAAIAHVQCAVERRLGPANG